MRACMCVCLYVYLCVCVCTRGYCDPVCSPLAALLAGKPLKLNEGVCVCVYACVCVHVCILVCACVYIRTVNNVMLVRM